MGSVAAAPGSSAQAQWRRLRLQCAGSVAVVHGLSCSNWGIFSDQEWNLCLLHWLADSYPLHDLGRPWNCSFF